MKTDAEGRFTVRIGSLGGKDGDLLSIVPRAHHGVAVTNLSLGGTGFPILNKGQNHIVAMLPPTICPLPDKTVPEHPPAREGA